MNPKAAAVGMLLGIAIFAVAVLLAGGVQWYADNRCERIMESRR